MEVQHKIIEGNNFQHFWKPIFYFVGTTGKTYNLIQNIPEHEKQ